MDDYQKEINTVKETRQTELELEKAKQKTLKDSQKLARANTSIKRDVFKLIKWLILIGVSIIGSTFILSIFLPNNVERALDIIKNIF